MTTNNDRLDRIEVAIERNTADIAQLKVLVEANTQNIQTLAAVAHDQQSITSIEQSVGILVQEVRGLRAENRRILAHLFGENGS